MSDQKPKPFKHKRAATQPCVITIQMPMGDPVVFKLEPLNPLYRGKVDLDSLPVTEIPTRSN